MQMYIYSKVQLYRVNNMLLFMELLQVGLGHKLKTLRIVRAGFSDQMQSSFKEW